MLGRSVSPWRHSARSICSLVALFSLFAFRTGQAQPANPKPAAAPDCAAARSSALSAVACELGRAFSDVAGPVLVVSAPFKSDVPIPKQQALTLRLVNVVAGRIGGGARAESAASDLHHALRDARSAKALVYLTPELVAGQLRVTADAYKARVTFWAFVANPEPMPAAHAYATRAADAEIRSFFPVVPIVARRFDRVPGPEASPVAVACGDVGADGSLELVVVGRRRITVGRIAAGRFVSTFSRDWGELSPVAPSPLREPLGTAAISSNGSLDVALSDRASAFRLDGRGATIAALSELFPWPGGDCVRRAPTGLDPTVVRCAPEDAAVIALPASMPRTVDALAGAAITGPDGATRLVRAVRSASDDTVVVFDDAGHATRLASVGAQIAIGDLDGDGTPELVASRDTLDPAVDGVSIYSWGGSNALTRRLDFAAPAGVRALAVCPWLGDGMSPLVVATSSELMVVR